MATVSSVLADLLKTYGGTAITLALGLVLHGFVDEGMGLLVIGAAAGTLIDLNKGVRVVRPRDRQE